MEEVCLQTGTQTVVLRLLHPAAIVLPGGQRRALSPNDAAMLAILALRGDVPRPWMAGLLWPGKSAKLALNALRQRDFKLRIAAGAALLGKRALLSLADGVVHDLSDPYARLAADPSALREPLLGDYSYDGQSELAAQVQAERARWHQRVQDALVRLANEREAERRIADALAYGTRLLEHDPLREHSARLLMRLHHRRGDRGAALDVFERCKQALYEALGEAPGDETLALAQDIGRGQVHGITVLPPLPLALRHPPLTAGRQSLLDEVQTRLAEGRPVLITGPAGIGKTRVFDDLLARQPAALVCRLFPDDALADHGLLARLAAELLRSDRGVADGDGLAALHWLTQPRVWPPPGTMHRERLVALFSKALDTARQHGIRLVALDDVHYADPESLAVLAGLLATPHDGLGWLMTCRDRRWTGPLAQWLAARDGDQDPRIELPTLGEQQVAELLGSIAWPGLDPARWAAALTSHCGGHPLSLLQVLRALHERGALAAPAPPAELPVPHEALRRVARWLDDSDPRAQQLAFVAALAGADFDTDLAGQLLGCSATELVVPWRQLEALGILRGAGFTHELVRQALIEALPSALAPAIHRDIAAVLATSGRSPARRALHWRAAGQWRRAALDSLLAADESLAAGLQPRARELLLQAAVAHERAAEPAAAFDARWRAGRLTLSCASAADALAEAAQLLASAADARQRCLAHCLLARVRTEQHDHSALADASLAVDLAASLENPALRAAAGVRLASAQQVLGQHQAALDRLQTLDSLRQAMARDDRHDMHQVLTVVLGSLGRRSEALARCSAALDEALAEGDIERAASQAGDCCIQFGYLCRPEQALQAGEQAVALARRAGVQAGYVLIDEMNVFGCHVDLGHYSAALEIGERVVGELRAGGYTGWALNAENSLAGLFIQLGRYDLAQQRLPDAPAGAPTWVRAARRATQARLAAARGRSPLAALHEAVTMLEQGGTLLNPYVRSRIALDVARWSGPEQAVAGARACRDWAVSNEHTALTRLAAWIEIDGRLRCDDIAGAAQGADALAATVGEDWAAYNFYLPEMWWTLIRAWDAGGQRERADALARHGAGWIGCRAEQHMPALFVDSFLTRNPVNRALLRRARSASAG